MMKRRHFLHLGALASMTGVCPVSLCAEKNNRPTLQEVDRTIPVSGSYDVIVCGGGPAGVAASLASARSGAKTLLLEVNGCLGGIWTAGVLPWILNHDQPGIMKEIKDKLKAMNAVCPVPAHAFAFDPEKLKLLLEELCDEAKVDFLLHARIVAVTKSSDRTISHVITESKSGRQAWSGKMIVDCTGDGDVAAMAGCGFDVGDHNGHMQPGSLNAVIDGIRFDELKEYIRSNEDTGYASKGRLLKLFRPLDIEPTYKSPGIYPIREDLFWIMFNHAYDVRFDDVRSITRHTVEGRRELHRIIDALRSQGGPWKNVRIIGTAEQLGIREARRIHGLYTVTAQDIVDGIRHEDAVCRASFGFDVHALGIDQVHGHSNPERKPKPYDIPARALISKDMDNLLMAGRCISGDFLAHSSYRVTGPAMMLGEAVGGIAAEAVSKNIHPKNVKYGKNK